MTLTFKRTPSGLFLLFLLISSNSCTSLVSFAQAQSLHLPTVVSGDMSSSLNLTSAPLDAGSADKGWYITGGSQHWSLGSVGGKDAIIRDGTDPLSYKWLAQVIHDQKETKNDYGMIFSVDSIDTASASEMVAYVYGINTFSTGFNLYNGATDPNAELLGMLDTYLSGETIRWAVNYMPIDFSNDGYEYIVIVFKAKRTFSPSSHIALSDVRFVKPAQPAVAAFPYPHQVEYNHGFKPDVHTQSEMNRNIKDAWNVFKSKFLTNISEGTNQHELRQGEWRVIWPKAGYTLTVSEGIAYAMLLSVLMADNKTSSGEAPDKELFDGLLYYYQRRLNSNGFMNWKVVAEDSWPMDSISDATDADEDVALALVLADKQWGSHENGIPYLELAKTIINRLKSRAVHEYPPEVGASNPLQSRFLFKTDSFESTFQNISYYAPAWYKVYSEITGDPFWNRVATDCYSEIQYFFDSQAATDTQGLVPDWHKPEDRTATPFLSKGYDHSFDACRVGWRIGHDYLWHGTSQHQLAFDNSYKLAEFMRLKTAGTPKQIKEYNLDGSVVAGSANALSLVAPVGVAAMVSDEPEMRQWRNQLYLYILDPTNQPDSYYAQTLRMMSLLTMSGNFPNLVDLGKRGGILNRDMSFEETPSIWHTSTGTIDIVNDSNLSYSGKYFAKIPSGASRSYLYQTFFVEPNATYSVKWPPKTGHEA